GFALIKDLYVSGKPDDRELAQHIFENLSTNTSKFGGKSQDTFEKLDKELATVFEANDAVRQFVKGYYHYYRAWESRGDGMASSVSSKKSREFKEQLDLAKTALEKSWAANP